MDLKGNRLWWPKLSENVRELWPILGFDISNDGQSSTAIVLVDGKKRDKSNVADNLNLNLILELIPITVNWVHHNTAYLVMSQNTEYFA